MFFNALYITCMTLIGLCIFSVFTAVIIDFVEFHKRENPKKQRKSFVETGTMTLFFILFYLVIRFNIGSVDSNNLLLRLFLLLLGTIIIIFGTCFNIIGRFYLGKNWANQIKIYSNHFLVADGPYKLVRHPLYASIIWMFYGACIIYLNWLAFLLNTLIFIPMMYYRAKQEENLLLEQFKNYKAYSKKVGMFFPKIIK